MPQNGWDVLEECGLEPVGHSSFAPLGHIYPFPWAKENPHLPPRSDLVNPSLRGGLLVQNRLSPFELHDLSICSRADSREIGLKVSRCGSEKTLLCILNKINKSLWSNANSAAKSSPLSEVMSKAIAAIAITPYCLVLSAGPQQPFQL